MLKLGENNVDRGKVVWYGMRSFDYHRLGDCLWDGEVVSFFL